MSDKTFRIETYSKDFRKWDIIRIAGSKQEGVVLDVSQSGGAHSITMYPYRRRKTIFGKGVWFLWLKLRIWLEVIKIKKQ